MGTLASENVYISELPPQLTKEECESILQAYGTVMQCKMLPPKQPGQKAAALVRFSGIEEAQWIIDNLNGNLAEGLNEPIVCRFANPPTTTSAAGEAKGYGKYCGKGCVDGPYGKGPACWGSGKLGMMWGKGGCRCSGKPSVSFYHLYGAVKKAGLLGPPQVPQECMVYVRNLPTDTSDLDLYKLFSPFGAIAPTGCKAMANEDGSCKGFGFVDFIEPTSCAMAIATLSGFMMPDGSTLSVACKAPSRKGKGKGYGEELGLGS